MSFFINSIPAVEYSIGLTVQYFSPVRTDYIFILFVTIVTTEFNIQEANST